LPIDISANICILIVSIISGYEVKLTPLDRQIIILLNQDARLPSAQIALRLGVSERTVRNRISRLIQEGVIRPVAVVNPSTFGYDLVVDIFCDVDMAQRDSVIKALAEMPEISYIAASTGDQDLSIQALFKNSTDMHAFITTRLYQVDGIRRTRTVLVPSIVKDTYQWLPVEEDFSL